MEQDLSNQSLAFKKDFFGVYFDVIKINLFYIHRLQFLKLS